MEKKYLTASLAEDFFIDMAKIFSEFRDKIDAKKICDGDRHYELFAIFIENYAVLFDEEYKPLLYQLSILLANSNALHCPEEDVTFDNGEYWQQPDFFDNYE